MRKRMYSTFSPVMLAETSIKKNTKVTLEFALTGKNIKAKR